MKLEDEPWVLEFDAEGSMHIRDVTGGPDRVEEMWQGLDSFFAGEDAKVIPTGNRADDTIKPVEISSTLRRSTRFTGYTPGKYYESD